MWRYICISSLIAVVSTLAVEVKYSHAQQAGAQSVAQSTIGTSTTEAPSAAEDTRRDVVGDPSQSTGAADASASSDSSGGPRPSDEGTRMTAFGDWNLECYEPAVSGVNCQMLHQTLSGDGGQVLNVYSLAYIPEADHTRLQFALPLGFAVQPGVRMEIGDGFQSEIPVSRCTSQGCLIEGVAAAEFLNAMRNEGQGKITVQTVNGGTVEFPLSLNGFAQAYDAMRSQNAQ